MSLNFPANPTNGDTYTSGSITYVYQDPPGKWTASTQVNLDSRYVNASGDTMTGNLTVPSLNNGQIAFRNQIINGCLRNWQRGPAGNGTDYGADRMFFANPGTGGNNERDTNAPPESGLQYAYAINQNAILVNSVEIPGNGSPFVNGSEWTFSFYARLDIRETSDNEIQFATGNKAATNAVSLASGFTWSKETLASGWRRYSYTFTVGSNPAAGNNCLRLWFRNAGTRNTVTGFQLEPGPVSTPFEQRPIATELALCQRYYEIVGVAHLTTAWSSIANTVNYAARKRVSPTVSAFIDSGPATAVWSSSLATAPDANLSTALQTVGNSFVAGGWITADAEL